MKRLEQAKPVARAMGRKKAEKKPVRSWSSDPRQSTLEML
jgi:hypothetical protein